LALQCPRSEQYHIQSEAALVEILNDEGWPCAPGEIGHVVATPLHNFAMPLIRYRIGDMAQAGAACACGRGLPVISRICGRVRNMLTLPSGSKHWPTLGNMLRGSAGKIRQYQCIQRTSRQIDVRLVLRSAMTAEEENGLRASMHEALGYPFE